MPKPAALRQYDLPNGKLCRQIARGTPGYAPTCRMIDPMPALLAYSRCASLI